MNRAEELSKRLRCFGPTGLLVVAVSSCALDQADKPSIDALPIASIEIDWRIDGYEADLVPITWLGVSPASVVGVMQGQDQTVRFFDASGRPIRSIGGRGSGPGEFEGVLRGGWMGDTLWLSDTNLHRVTLISPELEFIRTLPPLSSARPNATEADRFPTYSLAVPYALHEGEIQLVIGLLPIAGPVRTVQTGPPLYRVSTNGLILNHVVDTPRRDGGTVELGSIPFFASPQWTVAPDGKRIGTLSVDQGDASPDTVRVAAFDAISGEELFRRVYAFEAVSIPEHVADSAVAERVRSAMLTRPTPAMAAEMRAAIPRTYPVADRILIGSDHRFWIGLHARGEVKPWLLLASEGRPMARIHLPRRVRLVAADESHVWVVERDSLDVESIIRYRYRLGTR